MALVGSCYLYTWGAPEFFFMLILGLICDFYLVKLTALSSGRLRKWLLGINITLNVGMLAVVKYLNFFVDSFSSLFKLFGGEGLQIAQIVLAVGCAIICTSLSAAIG